MLLGIDLGSYQTHVAGIDIDGAQEPNALLGAFTVPSRVAMEEDGRLLYGPDAE